ncbi:hypothetical protein Trydic_g3962 [Trypoxylus dichotomus]
MCLEGFMEEESGYAHNLLLEPLDFGLLHFFRQKGIQDLEDHLRKLIVTNRLKAIKCCCENMRGMQSKVWCFVHHCASQDYEIVGITETRLYEDISKSDAYVVYSENLKKGHVKREKSGPNAANRAEVRETATEGETDATDHLVGGRRPPGRPTSPPGLISSRIDHRNEGRCDPGKPARTEEERRSLGPRRIEGRRAIWATACGRMGHSSSHKSKGPPARRNNSQEAKDIQEDARKIVRSEIANDCAIKYLRLALRLGGGVQ